MTTSAAPAAYADYRTPRLFGSLDGLRAVSILGVVWHHAGETVRLPIATRGFLGVDMFFVISGFLIVTLLLRERDKHGDISLRAFWVRRALRIFPLYYGFILALVLLVLGLGLSSPRWTALIRELPIHLTYTSNWFEIASLLGIGWSLSSEEQFYAVWPPIERHLQRWIWPVLAVALAINQAMNFHLLPLPAHAYETLEIVQSTFTPILLGVALAHLLHAEASFPRLWSVFGQAWAAPAFALLLLVLLCLPAADIAGAHRLGLQLAMAGLLAACVIREDHPLAAALGIRPLRRIGTVSYGIYLLHIFAMTPMPAILGQLGGAATLPGVRFAFALALAWIAAEVSFRFYETPFLRLKSRFSRG